MKRKHCFDSVGQWSASGDAAGDTGRGHPVREWNEGISSRGETVESPRGVASPLDGEEFSDGPGEQCRRVDFVVWDRQWSACLSLLEAGEEQRKMFV